MTDTVNVPIRDLTTHDLVVDLWKRIRKMEATQVALSQKLEAAMTDLQADVRAVLDVLKGQLPALQTKIATLEGQVTQLTGDNTAALATIQELKDATASMETEALDRIQGVDDLLESELPAPTP